MQPEKEVPDVMYGEDSLLPRKQENHVIDITCHMVDVSMHFSQTPRINEHLSARAGFVFNEFNVGSHFLSDRMK